MKIVSLAAVAVLVAAIAPSTYAASQSNTMKHKTPKKRFIRQGSKGGTYKYEMRGITGRWVGPADINIDLTLYPVGEFPTFRYEYFAPVSTSDSRMGARGNYAEAVQRCADVGGEVAAFEDPNDHRFAMTLLDNNRHGYWIGATTLDVRTDEPIWLKENGNKWDDSLLQPGYNTKNSQWTCLSGGINNGNPYVFRTSPCNLKKRIICQLGGTLLISTSTTGLQTTTTTTSSTTGGPEIPTTSTTGGPEIPTTSTTDGPDTTTVTSITTPSTRTTGPTVARVDCGFVWVSTGKPKQNKGMYKKVDNYTPYMKYTNQGMVHPKWLNSGTLIKTSNLERCRKACDNEWDANEGDITNGCKAFTFYKKRSKCWLYRPRLLDDPLVKSNNGGHVTYERKSGC